MIFRGIPLKFSPPFWGKSQPAGIGPAFVSFLNSFPTVEAAIEGLPEASGSDLESLQVKGMRGEIT